MQITTVGLDLTKNVIQLHAVNQHGKAVLKKSLKRNLGLVPRQHSSGGKPTFLGISKRGDSYLRTLLIHGARAVLRVAQRKANYASSWLANLMNRRHQNIAAVALANKNARIIWALLTHNRDYPANFQLEG